MSRLIALTSLLLVVLLCAPSLVQAQGIPCGLGPLVAFSKETLTISTTAVALTQSKYAPTTGVNAGAVALVALVTVLTATIGVLDDGTTPTATDGAVFTANSQFWLCRNSIARSLMIRQATADATVQIIYYRSQ